MDDKKLETKKLFRPELKILEEWERMVTEREDFRRISQNYYNKNEGKYAGDFPNCVVFYHNFCKDVASAEEYYLNMERQLIEAYKKLCNKETESEMQ